MSTWAKREISDCKTCTMKRSSLPRRINSKLKKLAKTNLTDIFASEPFDYPNSTLPSRNEMVEIHRNKIKADYHYSPSFIGTSKLERNELQVRRIEFSSKEYSPNKPTLREQLQHFAQKHNPTSDMFQDMLKIMQRNGLSVPSDVLEQEKQDGFEIINMTFGHYLSFGVAQSLTTVLNKIGSKDVAIPSALKLDLAFFFRKSRPSENDRKPPHHLVIQGRLKNCDFDESFVVGIYRGSFPSLLIGNQILKPLFNELRTFERGALTIAGRELKVQVNGLICDPIANSIVTCTSLPDTINGCSKCNQQGTLQSHLNSPSFPSSASLGYARNDDDFRICIQNGHHLGIPILSELNVGLVSQVAIDYKTFMCEGVMKKLLTLWTKGKLDYRLNHEALRRMSAEILLVAKDLPREFSEKPKTMDELEDWTPLDYRQFLLYYGPFLLKMYLPRRYYDHFLLFHTSTRLLIHNRDFHRLGTFWAGKYFADFCAAFVHLYGREHVDYDIHNLLHVEDMCMRLGCLDDIGGFRFSSNLERLETLFEESVVDMGKGVVEHTKMLFENKINSLGNKYPLFKTPADQTMVLGDFTLTSKWPDNFVFTQRGVAVIDAICGETDGDVEIVGKIFANSDPLYKLKVEHHRFMIVSNLSETTKIKLEEIEFKAIPFNTEWGLAVMPFLNF